MPVERRLERRHSWPTFSEVVADGVVFGGRLFRAIESRPRFVALEVKLRRSCAARLFVLRSAFSDHVLVVITLSCVQCTIDLFPFSFVDKMEI